MNHKWEYFLPGYIWSLPNTLFALVVAVVFYRATNWRWSNGCIEAIGGDRMWGKPAAQCVGNVIVYSSEKWRDNGPIRAHERVHAWQAMLLGPLFLPVYFILWGVLLIKHGSHRAAYDKHPMERQAYRLMRNAGAWGRK